MTSALILHIPCWLLLLLKTIWVVYRGMYLPIGVYELHLMRGELFTNSSWLRQILHCRLVKLQFHSFFRISHNWTAHIWCSFKYVDLWRLGLNPWLIERLFRLSFLRNGRHRSGWSNFANPLLLRWFVLYSSYTKRRSLVIRFDN